MSSNRAFLRYFLSLSLLLFAASAFSQTTWKADRYNGIPAHDKADILFEDFVTDGGAFPVNRSAMERQEKVYNGEFYIISYGHKPVYKLYSQSIDTKDDYEIEMKFRFGEGFSYTMAGMAFGGDQRNSHFRFITDVYGNYEISIHQHGTDKILNSGQTRRRYSADESRTLTLRKVKSKWHFFISEELVHQTSEMAFFGDRLGFRLGGTRTMKVDYYRVSSLQSSDILGPIISLSQPQMTSGNLAVVNEKRAYISGRLTDQSGVEGLTINNQPISIDKNGNFQASLQMPTDKRIAIKMEATDVYGNPTNRDFYLEYQNPAAVAYTPPKPQQQAQNNSYNTSSYNQQTVTRPRQVPNRPANVSAPLTRGENYLLVIGVNNYRHWSYLNNAVKDCRDVTRALTQYYMFDPQNVFTLFNEEASRENILEKLEQINNQIRPEDNLLVYYAGHGYYNNSTELGYWVPYDARKDKVSDFIPNSTVRDYVRQIDAHNTFLIADACYSGSMFGTSRGNNYSRDARSRWAFTSGDIEKVWDGQPGQNSPFARYLISYLKSNTKAELTAFELIDAVSNQVRNNTQQKPQGAPLRQADDQGGMFIFQRR